MAPNAIDKTNSKAPGERFEVFGRHVTLGQGLALDGYPFYYQADYEIRQAKIGAAPCIAIIPKVSVKPAQLAKMTAELERCEGLPCLVISDHVAPVQREDLTRRGVAWICSSKTFSIPFLVASSDAGDYRARPRELGPQAQRIACHIIDGSWLGLTTTQIAQKLGRSLASAANYLHEIEAVAPILVGRRGRTRFIDGNGLSSSDLADLLLPHMSSPVKRRVYYRTAEGCERQIDHLVRGMPKSGLSAISELSAVADDPWITRAVFAGDSVAAEQLDELCRIVGEYDSPDLLIEFWCYEPDGRDGIVNLVALRLVARELVEITGDERVEGALEEIEETIVHGYPRS